MHFHVIYEVIHSGLMERETTLCYANDAFIQKLKISSSKMNELRKKNIYNDDAPKRSGVIEKGTRYFQEIVTMNNEVRMDENMYAFVNLYQ